MAQRAARESTVTIADKSFRVCFSIIGIVALRDHWGLESDDEVLLKIDEIAKKHAPPPKGEGKIDFRQVRDLTWAGLQEHHPDVTPDEAMKLISQAGLDGVPAIMEAIFGTLAAAAPPQGARQTRPPKKVNGRSVSTT